jgi:hypothetical protein
MFGLSFAKPQRTPQGEATALNLALTGETNTEHEFRRQAFCSLDPHFVFDAWNASSADAYLPHG